jgi:hypothetical protein
LRRLAMLRASGSTGSSHGLLRAGYWRPVYAFLRRKGHDHHAACDFTQEFFLAIFSRDWAVRADESRGRFRTFLITLLDRFTRDILAKRQSKFERRQAGLPFEIVEKDARLLGWDSADSAETAFWMHDRIPCAPYEFFCAKNGGKWLINSLLLDAVSGPQEELNDITLTVPSA